MNPEPISADPPPRPGPAPLPAVLTDVTFVHWPYEPAEVAGLLPAGTTPDVHDGAAYVGIVAFRMRSHGEFLETNVRTYTVDRQGRRGVLFLTMEADRLPWVLAARTATLPYRWSRMSLTRDGDRVRYESRRRWPGPRGLASRITVDVGAPISGGALDHFLTARWRLHHRLPGVTVAVGLTHERWPLHSADLVELDDDLVAGAGLRAPSGPPASVLHSPGTAGRLGLPRPVSRR